MAGETRRSKCRAASLDTGLVEKGALGRPADAWGGERGVDTFLLPIAISLCGWVVGRSGAATATSGSRRKVRLDVIGLNDSASGAATSMTAAAPTREKPLRGMGGPGMDAAVVRVRGREKSPASG